MLHNTQPAVKSLVAFSADDSAEPAGLRLRMARPTKIHAGKTPQRIHYIAEWAERRHVTRADIIRELGADKGTVSRWFAGSLPSEAYLLPLSHLLGVEEPAILFRHPDDDWLAKFFRDRQGEERERAIRLLETAFPKRA